MRFLANENFLLTSVNYLRSKGYDIIAVGVDFPGITDSEVIELAEHENRTIITFDKDYGELIFRFGNKPSEGVIFLRLDSYSPEEPGKIIETIISIGNFSTHRMLTVFDGLFIRQKNY